MRLTKISAFVFVVLFIFSTFAFAANDKSIDQVVFNVKTYKVHKLSCTWAARCTKNCITIPRAEAYKRGGVPCKVCGG